jgi:hypothetical protein
MTAWMACENDSFFGAAFSRFYAFEAEDLANGASDYGSLETRLK